MAEKTNKSYTKRIKITASGKMMGRKQGRNHFNAKQTRTELQKKKQMREVILPSKVANQNLPHGKA